MLDLIRYALCAIARLILPLRYVVRVRGLEALRGIKGPVLVLPNHPAYVDPIILFALLWPRLKMRPMVYTGAFDHPLFRAIKWLLNAHEVPDLEHASGRALAAAEQALAALIDGLRRGENQILWPSGHVWRDGQERLEASRAAADVLRSVPEATVILVRTRGLWGSSFSYAWGGQPGLMRGLIAGAAWLLANLLFLMPRRHVEITVERIARGSLPELTREALNPWLEHWYNQEGPESPTYIPYHFLAPRRAPAVAARPLLEKNKVGTVRPETREEVRHILEDRLGRPLSDREMVPEARLDHLGLDSLDRIEVTLAVERQFEFTAEQPPTTLGQLWALAEGLVEKAPPKPPPPEWFRFPSDGRTEILADTIPAAFVARALANPKDVAVADDQSGVLTCEQLLAAVLVTARRFARLPGPNVGLLLPASVGGDIALLALLMAGKLPVLLNWTTGPAHLAHAARVMNLTHVVTSQPFIDRTGIEVAGTRHVYLEDVRRDVGFFEKLRTLLGLRFRPGSVRRRVPSVSPHQPAVVLFTSGSEKAPKAVPLTHANILADQRLGLPVMGLTRHDIALSFLPPFHSFGMTVTGLFPLLGGVRVVRHPDPLDASGLARKAVAYGATLMVGTPTFVGRIVRRTKPGEMKDLRVIVVGAEECPPRLFDLCARAAPGAVVLEGYGVTECSPVVTVNPPEAPRKGSVGKPLPGVEVRVVDLDTGQPLPAGEMGMLQVSGPTVFPGYIAHDGPPPFVEERGKRWYVTGDLGVIDTDGYVWFRGRLKRFLKAGGEMISLPALEEPFARLYPPTEEGPAVAVEGVERDGGRHIVLFTTRPIGLREANAVLTREGFHGVMRVNEVRRVEKIPTLGTGKTDYKVLRAQLEREAQHHCEASRQRDDGLPRESSV